MPFHGLLPYARHMTELDQVWSQMVGDAFASASKAGQQSVADYLRLRATNDAIRTAGVGWLFDAFIEVAGNATRKYPNVDITREEPHNFPFGNSNMVGSLLSIRNGVRCLTVEAGWTRTPRDGIMHEGALAAARITHFGLPKEGVECRLVYADVLPVWLAASGLALDSREVSRHIDVFLEV